MSIDPELHRNIRTFFETSNNFSIISHVRPDGDAIGSVLALGLSLKTLGKKVQMILVDGVPNSFRFLEGASQIKRKISTEFTNIIVVDCSDKRRLGHEIDPAQIKLNIDHHITNIEFGTLNLVEADASATCEILTENMPRWGLPITSAVANGLLAGILNDTIGFKTSNVTAKTLRLSADLVDIGAELAKIYSNTLDSRSFQAARYWGFGLNYLQKEGDIVWTVLSQNDRISANYPGNDDADLVNILSSIDDAIISVIFIEQKNGTVKVSWRAKPGTNVSKVAYEFGGGGHTAASSAEISGTLDSVIAKVLKATKTLT